LPRFCINALVFLVFIIVLIAIPVLELIVVVVVIHVRIIIKVKASHKGAHRVVALGHDVGSVTGLTFSRLGGG